MTREAASPATDYNKNPESEWNRLEKDAYHRIEYEIVTHYLRKYLPESGKLLDAGGGPGRYTFELARQGYDVTLLDLSEGCIRLAKHKLRTEFHALSNTVSELLVGDVRDLSHFSNNSFDGTLCLDPLTYLTDSKDRKRAVTELVRVTKPTSPLFLGGRGFLAVLRTVLSRSSDTLLSESFKELLKHGDVSIGSVKGHFFRAQEIRTLAESCGLDTLEMAGCEGLSTGLWEATNALQDTDKWGNWLNVVIETSNQPSIVDFAEHILYIGSVRE